MSQKTRSHKKPAKPVTLPAVRCHYDKLEEPTSLQPNEKSEWHEHSKEQLDLYWKIMMETGVRRAIVVSKRSGKITKGHGQRLAAIAHACPRVPVEYQDYDSDEQEIADLIADNRLAKFAKDNDNKLRAVLAELDGKIDLSIAGLTQAEIDDLQIKSPDGTSAEFPITAKLHERYDYVVIFTENEPDFLHLQNLTGVRTEKSYKNSHIGTGRVVPFKRFLKAIHSHRHTLDEPGGNDDHASPPKKRPVRSVRSRKPKK